MKTPAFTKKILPWLSRRWDAVQPKGKSLWRILTLSPADDAISRKRSLGISIEHGCIRVAEGRRIFSRINVGALKSYTFEEGKLPNPEQLADTVYSAVRELKAGGAQINLGIPKEWAIFRCVELPVSVKANLPDVVSYEMDRLTPLTAEEAFYDFTVIEENAHRLRIALAAAKAKVINPYLKALRDKGISVNAVYINLTSIAALLNFAGQVENSILLTIDDNSYEYALLQKGGICTAIAEQLGEADDESIISQAFHEVSAFYRGQKDEEKPQRIYAILAGRLADRGYHILEKFAQVPAEIPCEIPGRTGPKIRISGKEINTPCAAVGSSVVSLRPGPRPMNLLSKGRHEQPKPSFAVTILLAIIALSALAFLIVSPIELEQRKAEEMNSQIAAKKAEVAKSEALRKEIENVSRDIAFINSIKTDLPPSVDIIKELTAILPKSVWLARLRIADSVVEMEGYAAGSTTDILPLLENSRYFQKVEFASPTYRDTRMKMDRFVIRMEIKGVKNGNGKPQEEKKI